MPDHGPISEAPNPIQRFAGRGSWASALVFTVVLSPLLLGFVAAGASELFIVAAFAALFFVVWFAIGYRLSQMNPEQREAEREVSYLPWFGDGER